MIAGSSWPIEPTPYQSLGDRRRFPAPVDARRAETLADESPYRGPTGGTVHHHQVTRVVRKAPRVRPEVIDD
jgi:hypothetical protein